MVQRDRIVVGASAGGIEALRRLVAGWPADLAAAVLVVVHLPPSCKSVLPRVLSRAGALPARHPEDGEELQLGTIYVAPPDYHMLIVADHVRLHSGTMIHSNRPAVDPLFHSAARWTGPRTIGLVLSGALDDGTSGMLALRRAGALLAVQSVHDAAYSSMPSSVLAAVEVDYVGNASELSAWTAAQVNQAPAAMWSDAPRDDGAKQSSNDTMAGAARTPEQGVKTDLSQLMPDGVENEPPLPNGSSSRFACPACHGTLWELSDGQLIRYRCRTGHVFSPASLSACADGALEQALWTAFRALQELAELSSKLAERARRRGFSQAAERYERREVVARERASLVRRALQAPSPPADDGDAEAVALEET